MLSKFLLGFSLLGAEWVLYLLLAVSIYSIAVIAERVRFFREATRDAALFRQQIRQSVSMGQKAEALKATQLRLSQKRFRAPDFDSQLVEVLLNAKQTHHDSLDALATDALLQTRVQWEKNLSVLATIGSNAPFVGLFGTVLGIIQAFNDLSHRNAAAGMQSVTAGMSDALIATAVGILVAIPAVVAFNFFQRRVKTAYTESEALRNFLMAHFTH